MADHGRRGRAAWAGPQANPRRAPATILVDSCADDGGAGTLRNAMVDAVSGDTIDLTALTCSTISLEAGALATSVDDLSLVGPGASLLSIDAGGTDSVLIHAGAGTIDIAGLSLINGTYDADLRFPLGGCLYSSGNVDLADSIVSTCSLSGLNYAYGGAIYARGNVVLERTTVSGSAARGLDRASRAAGGAVFARGSLSMLRSLVSDAAVYARYDSRAKGGGVYVQGELLAEYSTVAGSRALPGIGGGIFSLANVTIRSSTFSGNAADTGGAIALDRAFGTTPVAAIVNSTVSGNSATELAAGISARVSLALANSTIAFNTAAGPYSYSYLAAGLVLIDGVAHSIDSSIIANNTSAGVEADLTATDLFNLSGADNLIMTATNAEPGGTIRDDPQLAPLSNNGGPARTHRLAADSPAIDAGNNAANLDFDQRGAGFPRVVGAAADIGAFEWSDDTIFADGFD